MVIDNEGHVRPHWNRTHRKILEHGEAAYRAKYGIHIDQQLGPVESVIDIDRGSRPPVVSSVSLCIPCWLNKQRTIGEHINKVPLDGTEGSQVQVKDPAFSCLRAFQGS